ncbi:MAG: RNA polymerase sigma factor [Calditrichaeota bacterium]|nr:MAG: RNA polymerase sigma factor [Calditrichota bacterium]
MIFFNETFQLEVVSYSNMEMHPETIRLIKKRHPAAIRELVDTYKDYIYTLALRMAKNNMLAEEITQDVFIKVIRHIDTFQAGARFTTWLYTITFRTALNTLRGCPRHEPLTAEEEPVTTSSVTDSLQKEDQRRLLKEAMEHIPCKQAACLTMFYIQQLSLKEIHTITGWPVSAIKTHLFRGRKALQKLLNRQFSPGEIT